LIPLRDENPTILTPYVTVALILANVFVWLYVEGAGASPGLLTRMVCEFGMIPAEVTGRTGSYGGVVLGPGAACRFGGLTWQAILTSMFLHGSWMHLIGNMWFLWIFGNNIEDSMGHFRYLVFYLLTGVAAAMAQVVSDPSSPVPTVGASGAISGIMGAYIVLYPRVRIQTLFIFFFIIRIIPVPAWLILGQWFALQLISTRTSAQAGAGVAFWAHVGGFVAGALLVKLFENRKLVAARQAKAAERLGGEDRRNPWQWQG
jgi:membrane associated rhomboid family serine protease